MTREEHIENLKVIASDMPSDKCSDWIESLMAGVKALEKEPCDDCIRRSDIGLTDFEIVMCNGDYKEGLKMLLDKVEKPHQ